MNVLMGKVDKTGGKTLINGQESEVHLYRKIIGYVPQEDVMLKELTVRENILHSARVRLPRSWSDKQIQNHVDNILETLKLSHIANSIIGDENARGISGGQRKRVNIGMELAAAPLTIFLDEPTSGLDSTSALDVTDLLHSMSTLGLTIIAVIHQPRVEIFRKFHDVILIAPGGRVAFMGPVGSIQPYFEALGFEFGEAANGSDVAMDILAGKGVNRVAGVLGSRQVVELWEDRGLRRAFVKGVKEQKRAAMGRKGGGGSDATEGGSGSGSGSGRGRGGVKRVAVAPPGVAVTPCFGHGVFSTGASAFRINEAEEREDPDDGNWDVQWGNEWGNPIDTVRLLGTGDGKQPPLMVQQVARVRRLSPTGLDSSTLHKYAALETPMNTFFNKSVSMAAAAALKRESVTNPIDSWRNSVMEQADIPLLPMRRNGRVSMYASDSEDDGIQSQSRSSFSTLVAAPLLFQSIKNYHNSVGYSMARPTQPSAHGIDSESDELSDGEGSQQRRDPLRDSVKEKQKQRAWKENREFHRIVPIVVESRGAGFWKQLWYCHQRSLVQQSRSVSAFVMEIVVAVVAGALMGISTQGGIFKELYSSAYIGVYAAVSPKPTDIISLYCFLVGLAVALASAPAAVKVFGEEKTVYWREAACGHSRFAYFLGKTISTFYRIVIMSLHFTAVYMFLAKPIISPYTQYTIVLLQYWGVYGMSCIISMLVRRENASLLAVVMCLFASVFCGYGPSLAQAEQWGMSWVMEMSFNKWAAEAMYASSVMLYQDQYDVKMTADMFGWSLDQVAFDYAMCFGLGLGMRAIAFGLLVALNRDKQR
ncbi:hypothetical protein HDU98_007365 [Podochytrium sp. JEL0797]|nr:hypothetical protein HDU98_007365 [Podochytrium sp. JEL0797]